MQGKMLDLRVVIAGRSPIKNSTANNQRQRGYPLQINAFVPDTHRILIQQRFYQCLPDTLINPRRDLRLLRQYHSNLVQPLRLS